MLQCRQVGECAISFNNSHYTHPNLIYTKLLRRRIKKTLKGVGVQNMPGIETADIISFF